MKHLPLLDLYIGTTAERTANFTSNTPEGTQFLDLDTSTLEIFAYGAWRTVGGGGGGSSTFLGLTDTPASYLGQAGSGLAVNGGETGLEFVALYDSADFDTDFSGKDTDDLSEGAGNLYFTSARFDTEFATKTTTDLAEGTNLYYTDGRFDTRFATKDTDDLSEGAGNLYFTSARFDTEFATKTTDDLVEGSTNLYSQWSNSTNGIDYSLGSVGIGTAASATTTLRMIRTMVNTSGSEHSVYVGGNADPPSAPSSSTYMVLRGEGYGLGSQDLSGATHVALFARSGSFNTSTLGTAYGANVGVENFSSGIITDAYALELYVNNSGAGSIVNGYGLKINNVAGSTSSYAIHSGTGLVSLGDDLEFRQASTISTTSGTLTFDPGDFVRLDKPFLMGVGTNQDSLMRLVYNNNDYQYGIRLSVTADSNTSTSPMFVQTGVTDTTFTGVTQNEFRVYHNAASGSGGTHISLGATLYVVNSGDFSSWRGLNVATPSYVGSGRPSSLYGIVIGDMTGATVNNYAIYTYSGTISLGDNLQFRQASTISTVSGTLTLDGFSGEQLGSPVGVNTTPFENANFRAGGTKVLTGVVAFLTNITAEILTVTSNTATEAAGLYAYPPIGSTLGSGSIGTSYGLYVKGSTEEAVTTTYAIYTEAHNISSGGNLEFRQASEIYTTSGRLRLYTGSSGVQIDAPIGIGTTPNSTYNVFIQTSQSHTTGTKYGMLSIHNYSPASDGTTATFNGHEFRLTNGSGYVLNIHRTVSAQSYITGTSTSNIVRNIESGTYVTGTVGTLYNIFISGTPTGTPTLTGNNFGLYISNVTLGVSNYAIYTNSGRVRFGDGVILGNPAGGNKGVGTLNAAADIYKNNSAYTNPDYALEWWATGKIEEFAENPGARHYRRYELDDIERFIRKRFRLPRMKPASPTGMFERGDMLLEKIEELYTHVIELHNRLKVLESSREQKGEVS